MPFLPALRRRLAAVVVAAALLAPGSASAQLLTRPHLDWRTVETEHFRVHFPAEMREWTTHVVARLEAVHDEVSRLVGSAPEERVTVLVDDPFNVSNGFALPFLDSPVIFLWPTPPDPTSGIGHHRGWGELLAVHEFAHLAHLTRPSRNPWQRFLWRIIPTELSPIARRAPRWVSEGYATYVEGELTGSGRPYGVLRPAVLRQRALEGKLPSYGQLSSFDGWQGGSMAYLVGSAYLEWLTERRGDESLVHLWRRMTARQDRGFVPAFVGVYGDTPADLYGRFTAELTGQALEIERMLRDAGLVVGDTVQVRDWYTGEPAVSPDGAQMAVVLGYEDSPSRLVVWNTAEEPEDSAAVRARERALERDPQDVPAIQVRPRPKKAIATLYAVAGRPYRQPRFLPDGDRILVSRSVPLGDGAERPDLFIWNLQDGDVHRVTHGAGLHHADPAPDGRRAAAVQCIAGMCSLVEVDLSSGAVTTLVRATAEDRFYRPRWSPDGSQIVAARQRAGRWELVLYDRASRTLRVVGPEQRWNRYDAAFLPDGRRLVAVSERGGIANLEIISLDRNTARPLTRVTSSVLSPAVDRTTGAVYFLVTHADGINVHRIHPDSVRIGDVVNVAARLAPAAPVTVAEPPPEPPAAAVPVDEPYGLGPRQLRFLPGGYIDAGGWTVTAMLQGSDPVGRLSWIVQGAYGDEGSWRGGSAAAEWRRFRPHFGLQGWFTQHEPSRQWGAIDPTDALDTEYVGGLATAELRVERARGPTVMRLGASTGELEGPGFVESAYRHLAFAELGLTRVASRGKWEGAIALDLHGAAGRTAGRAWQRWVVGGGIAIGRGGGGLEGLLMHAGVTPEDAVPFEQMIVGGIEPPLFDDAVLSQRLAMPAVPLGILGGDRMTIGRVRLFGGGGLEPYFWAARPDGADDWFRIVGSDLRWDVDAVTFARIPAFTVRAGTGYILDEPLKKRWRGYFSLTYRP